MNCVRLVWSRIELFIRYKDTGQSLEQCTEKLFTKANLTFFFFFVNFHVTCDSPECTVEKRNWHIRNKALSDCGHSNSEHAV